MSVLFYVDHSVWVEHFNNTEWQCNYPPTHCSWNGSAWVYVPTVAVIEVDPNSNIEITGDQVVFTDLSQNESAYVYKDYGLGYFGNFEIDFEAEITASDTNSRALICGLSNTINQFQFWDNGNFGLVVYALNNGGSLEIVLRDYGSAGADPTDSYVIGGTTSTLLYFRFKRLGTAITLNIYSDSNRTLLLDTLSITKASQGGQFRNLYILSAYDNGQPPVMSGYTQNFSILQHDSIDLTTFIENDPLGDITVTTNKITALNFPSRTNQHTIVRRDYDVGYFGDFIINFEAEITQSAANTWFGMNVSNYTSNHGLKTQTFSNEALVVDFRNPTGTGLEIRLTDYSTDNVDSYLVGGSVLAHTYLTFSRSGTTLTLDIYSDQNRSNLLDSLSIVGGGDTKRMLFAFANYNDNASTNQVDGWLGNYEIVSHQASGGPSTWGFSDIEPINTWSVGYRPTKIRVTYTGGTPANGWVLRDSASNVIATLGPGYISGTEVVCDFSNNLDIAELVEQIADESFQLLITNIEFFG